MMKRLARMVLEMNFQVTDSEVARQNLLRTLGR